MKNIVLQINKKAANREPHNLIYNSPNIPSKQLVEFFGTNLLPVVFPFSISETLDNIKTKILRRMANEHVQIRTGNYAIPKIYGSKERPTKIVKFDEWFNSLNNNDLVYEAGSFPPYLGNHKLDKSDIDRMGLKFPFFSKSIFSSPSLWVGPKGCTTPLHQDGPDNIIYQIKGSKKWILLHPFYANKLQIKQPLPETTPNFYISELNFQEFNIAEFTPTEIILNEGEALFLPSGWFLYVEALSLSITINFWINAEIQLPIYLRKLPYPSLMKNYKLP